MKKLAVAAILLLAACTDNPSANGGGAPPSDPSCDTENGACPDEVSGR